MPEQKNVLDQRHPLYLANADDWRFYNDSYIGGRRYTEGSALFPHFRETDKSYQDRVKRSYFVNLCAKVVDLYAAFVFKEEPSRSTEDAALTEFFADADRAGTPLTNLMRNAVCANGLIFGHAVIVVDLPSVDAAPRTKADDQRLKLRPYVTVYTPLDVVDWSLDRDGQYVFLRVLESAPDITDPMALRPTEAEAFRYRTWTRTEWFLQEADGTMVEQGTHGLGVVPAIRAILRPHLMYRDIGVSILRDIAPLNRALFNYASLLDEQLYRQTFPILTIAVTESFTKEKAKEVIAEVGTNNGLFFDGKGSPPGFIAPPVDSANVLTARIDAAAKEIIRLAKLQEKGGADKSGVAWRYEFQESNASFAQIARSLEEAEEQAVRLYYRWMGMEPPAFSIEYPSEFNIRALNEEIEETMALLEMRISPTFDRELKKRMVDSALPSADSETKQEMVDEIDEEPDPDAVLKEVQQHLADAEESGTEAAPDPEHMTTTPHATPPAPAPES